MLYQVQLNYTKISGSSGHDNMHFNVKSMKVRWGSYK